ncbi:NAD(P)/FAD-dependent oxidoreductase [Actinomadura luteofluorescens]|uniref:NAD(P)/FAD-dependent oxidoreductase n=1 Tax=Actinomadura luteofluorescens TaxID=46163 RepID=UPI00348B50BC
MAADPGCVVIGAGLAAANVAQTLREEGFDEPITLIGDERERPYERPALSKGYLQGSTQASSLYVHGENWYADHGIDTRFGQAAVSIDRLGQEVRLASGGSVPFRQLVITTGSCPCVLDIPGAGLAGVRTLRRIGDADALRAALDEGGRWVVIGGGWIGLEVASAARAAGREVTVLEQAPLPLQRVLGDRLGRYFAELHRSHGVDLRTGVSISEIVGSGGRATGVRTDRGLVPADLVVIGVGATPNTALAADAGLKVDGGVVADERLRTGDPAILAAGDVVNARNTALGRSLRVEHWDNAIRQGRLAAKSILGRPDQYDWQPYFYTDQFDLGMEYVGHAHADDDVVVRGDTADGEYIAFWLRDGLVTAAMNVNIWDVNDDLRSLIGRAITADRLADVDTALGDL